MNNLLLLKGQLISRKNLPGGGLSFKKTTHITAGFAKKLWRQLEQVKAEFLLDNKIGGVMVDVHYSRIVPKSCRITTMLTDGTIDGAARSIRGARFERIHNHGRAEIAHVFTHFVSFGVLEKSIETLKMVESVLRSRFNGEVTFDQLEQAKKKDFVLDRPGKKTLFLHAIKDMDVIQGFSATRTIYPDDKTAVVSLYDTGVATKELLARFDVNIADDKILDGNIVQLRGADIRKLNENAPYLISMSSIDVTKLPKFDYSKEEVDSFSLDQFPRPGNEPVIGVLDTAFDTDAYFSEWVEYTNCLPSSTMINLRDKVHGTAVSSIIVDGPHLNPWLEDGCGRFRVRHFGIMTLAPTSSFSILKRIREIVSENRDIKVWNLSLGSNQEVKDNSISPVGAELDKIQKAYGVVFVVAGTNVPNEELGRQDMKVGAPADSLNAIVVNAVDNNGDTASYTRIGPVLSFFYKPDVCYYGGGGYNARTGICVWNGVGKIYTCGTSFAAPWIARKLAYLIDVMGLPTEVAKGLIIDSAAQWKVPSHDEMIRRGYGIVPKSIDKILNSNDDEIKFVITGVADEYETHTYEIPVPVANGAHPYYAKATLVYFPDCDRSQGVDYTITEMDLYLGRVTLKDGRAHIMSINKNTQDCEDDYGPREDAARRLFRKWDNVKHISEELNPRAHPKKSTVSQMWGLKILTKDRRQTGIREKVKFGVVITLRAMDHVNRFNDFVDMCQMHHWIVHPLVPLARVEAYEQAMDRIELTND